MSQYSRYFALEKKLIGIIPGFERAEIIADFTDNKKRSIKDLTPHEYNEFVNWLQKTFITPAEVKSDNMRKKIISMFFRMGYVVNGQSDMPRIYSWTEKYGYLKKPLNSYSYTELPALVSQVEKVYKSHLNSI